MLNPFFSFLKHLLIRFFFLYIHVYLGAIFLIFWNIVKPLAGLCIVTRKHILYILLFFKLLHSTSGQKLHKEPSMFLKCIESERLN